MIAKCVDTISGRSFCAWPLDTFSASYYNPFKISYKGLKSRVSLTMNPIIEVMSCPVLKNGVQLVPSCGLLSV